MPQTAHCQICQASALFKKTLAAEEIEALARETRFVQRRRLVTAASVFWAFMVALGAQRMEYISDVLRTLNAREGWSMRYKPFWNRLAWALTKKDPLVLARRDPLRDHKIQIGRPRQSAEPRGRSSRAPVATLAARRSSRSTVAGRLVVDQGRVAEGSGHP